MLDWRGALAVGVVAYVRWRIAAWWVVVHDRSVTRLVSAIALGALSVVVASEWSGVARSAPVQRQWVITDLGTLAAAGGTSFSNGVNNRGQVVGDSTTKAGSRRAFLWQNGRMRDLGTLPGERSVGSSAVAINERGQIAGNSWGTGQASSHAVLWEKGTVRDLGTLGGKRSYATAINDRGQVVGKSTTKTGAEHAFLWQDGKMRDLGKFGWPGAINDRGQIVGWGRFPTDGRGEAHAALWESGRLRDLGPPGRPGGATGINERGQIVGGVSSLDCSRLMVWTRQTPSVDRLALLRSPCMGGNHDVEGHAAINERGQIAATGKQHAYLWENGKRLELGTLPGNNNSIAVAINDHGQIVGASGDRAVLWKLKRTT